MLLPDTLSVTHYSDDDANTVHFKVNSCCLKARNVQVQVQVRVQVHQKLDSSPARVQVQDSSPTTPRNTDNCHAQYSSEPYWKDVIKCRQKHDAF